MKLPDSTEILQTSVVAAFSVESATPVELSQKVIEEALGLSVDYYQGLSNQGPVLRMAMRSRNIEVLITPVRVECILGGGKPETSSAALLGQALHLVSKGISRWQAIGYNYAFTFPVPGEQAAANLIADRLLSRKGVERRLGQPLVGGAAWLYFTQGGKNVTVRFEPRGGDAASSRLWTTANYSQAPLAELPLPNVIAREVVEYYESFQTTLSKVL